MKLQRNPTTDANPDLRGQKHHFTIENAPAHVLEAMDEMLEEAGWDNDTCPLYDEGFSCGYWISISEVEYFKQDYKAAKAGVKARITAKSVAVAVEAAEEATHVEAVLTEELEAAQIAFFAGNDYAGRRAIIEAAHVEALADDAKINKANEYRAASRAADHAVSDAAFNAFWLWSDTMKIAAVNQEWEAMHAEALALNATFDTTFHRRAANWGAMDWLSREVALENTHAAALWINERMDRRAAMAARTRANEAEKARAAAPRTLADIIPRKARKARQKKPQVKIASIANGVYTWRVKMPNGRVYFFTENARIAQQKIQSPNGHTFKDVTSPYMLARISQAICDSLPKRRSRA